LHISQDLSFLQPAPLADRQTQTNAQLPIDWPSQTRAQAHMRQSEPPFRAHATGQIKSKNPGRWGSNRGFGPSTVQVDQPR
jgi:hypothetical protein